MIFNIGPVTAPKSTNSDPQMPGKWLLFGLIFLLAVAFIFKNDFLEFDENGKPIIAPYRQAKLDKELDELENCEQYALLAARDGYYPCFNCPGKSTIFLYKNETWKYGVTRKGEKDRYGTWHIDNHLLYVTQYTGTLQECIRQEKIKIYHYPTHPENVRRPAPLIRPPGNKRDT